jgi:hypothetical protein
MWYEREDGGAIAENAAEVIHLFGEPKEVSHEPPF